MLYEMVTGKRAFEGKSQLSVASAILEKEPVPINTIKPMTPPILDHVVRRCLAKDPEERWQSARDLALELAAVQTQPPVLARTFSRWPWLVAAAAAIIAVATLLLL